MFMVWALGVGRRRPRRRSESAYGQPSMSLLLRLHNDRMMIIVLSPYRLASKGVLRYLGIITTNISVSLAV
jgi:hypothetical protein